MLFKFFYIFSVFFITKSDVSCDSNQSALFKFLSKKAAVLTVN